MDAELERMAGPDDAGGWFARDGHADRAIEALRAECPRTRERAAQTLGQFGACRAARALMAGLTDSAVRVREACARALGTCGDGAAVPALLEAAVCRRVAVGTVVGALRALPTEADEGLARAVRHPSALARALCVRELGRRDAGESALVIALGDREAAVRAQAALAIAARREHPGEVGRGCLLGRVEDPDPRVRAALCRALVRLGSSGWHALERLRHDAEPAVARAAGIAMSEMSGPRAHAALAAG